MRDFRTNVPALVTKSQTLLLQSHRESKKHKQWYSDVVGERGSREFVLVKLLYQGIVVLSNALCLSTISRFLEDVVIAIRIECFTHLPYWQAHEWIALALYISRTHPKFFSRARREPISSHLKTSSQSGARRSISSPYSYILISPLRLPTLQHIIFTLQQATEHTARLNGRARGVQGQGSN